jgi:hypothetical protein
MIFQLARLNDRGLRAEKVPSMTTVSIPLPDEQVAALRLRAEQAGLPLETYLAQCVGQLLDRPADDFRRAAERILQTNAELYRRLA